MKFGNQSQLSSIVAEVGGAIEAAPSHAQIELYDALVDGCREAVQGHPETKVCCLILFNQVITCILNAMVFDKCKDELKEGGSTQHIYVDT